MSSLEGFDVSTRKLERFLILSPSFNLATVDSGSPYVLKRILRDFSKLQAAMSPIFDASQLEEMDRIRIVEATLLISLLTDDQTWITGSPHLVIGLKTASVRKVMFKLLDLSKRAGALSVCETLNSLKGRTPGLSDPAPSQEDILKILLFDIDQQKERINKERFNQSKLKQDSSKSPSSQEAQHLGAGLPEIESSSSTTTSADTGPTGVSGSQDTPTIKKTRPRPESSPREADPITGLQAPKPDEHVDQRTRLESSNLSSTPNTLTSTNPTSSVPRPNELFKSQGGPYDASFEHDALPSSSPSVRNEKRSEGVKMMQTLRARTSNHASAGGLSGEFDLKSRSGNLQSSSSSGPSSSSSPLNASRSRHPVVPAHEYLKSDAFYRSKQSLDSGENQLSLKEQIAGFESASESGADTEYETQSDSSKTQTEEHEDSQTGDENESGDEDSEGRNGEESESENEEELGDRNDEETRSVDTIDTQELESAVNAAMNSPPNVQQSSTSNSNSGGFRFVRPEETNRRRAETQESISSQASLSSHWGNVWPELKGDISDLSSDETGSERSGGTARERQEGGVQGEEENEDGGGGIEIEGLEDNARAPAGNDDLQDGA